MRLIPFLTAASFVLLLSCAHAASETATAPTLRASDANVLYEGRFDTSDATAPVAIWQGSRIRLDFESDTLELHFADVTGQNFFDADIGGRVSVVELREGLPPKGTAFSNLGPGRHRLVLFKRNEAASGTARFRGVTLSAEAQAFAPEAPRYKLAMQFFGDSITAGACNEDGATDQWEDRSTHNNARSYAAFTAAAFDADYRNIAVSGMGVSIGWAEPEAGEIWDRLYPNASSPRADLTSWTPHVIFVNLGENDDSYSKAKGLPFPETYTDNYVALVRDMRRAYPAAQIVILRGGMFGGAQSERLRKPWETAVARLEAEDARLTHFVFKHWSDHHPRVADHRAMADELIAWLREQPFMEAHL